MPPNSDHNSHANLYEQNQALLQSQSLPQSAIFSKAQRHFLDSINSLSPDNTYEQNSSNFFFRVSYNIQRNSIWNWTLFILSFVNMYIIIGQPTNRIDISTNNLSQYPTITQSDLNLFIELIILVLYISDVVMQLIRIKYDRTLNTNKFKLKLLFVILLTIDQTIFLILKQNYPVRPFRFVRSFMPYFYQSFSQKAMISLLSTYRDIITYLFFYSVLIFAFAFVCSQLIELSPHLQYDEYMSNYKDFGKMSFLIYVLASYDAWPDYQLRAVDTNKWNYVIFVSFIFLNSFYFVTIPTTVIFNSFKSYRRQMVLKERVRQKESLILCYQCLCQSQAESKNHSDKTLTTSTFSKFMLRIYKFKPRYINRIIYLNETLDPLSSGTISLQSFVQLNQLFQNDSNLNPPVLSFNTYYYKIKNVFKYRLQFQSVIESNTFHIITILILIANLLIIVVSFTTNLDNYDQYQQIFLFLFGVEIIVRLLGSGIEDYLKSKKNIIDLLIFGVCFAFEIFELYETDLESNFNITLKKLIKIIRLFRLSKLVKILLKYKYFHQKIYQNIYYKKIRLLFNQLIISVIVGLKMFPIFCTCFYILGLIGMELLDNRYNSVSDSPYRYSLYDKYSSFRNLIESQLVIVQVMIEAGWSPIVFDYSYRYNNFYGVCLFFVAIHVVVVIILVSLMKGMVADLYETIYNVYRNIERENVEEIQQTIKCDAMNKEQSQGKKKLFENNLQEQIKYNDQKSKNYLSKRKKNAKNKNKNKTKNIQNNKLSIQTQIYQNQYQSQAQKLVAPNIHNSNQLTQHRVSEEQNESFQKYLNQKFVLFKKQSQKNEYSATEQKLLFTNKSNESTTKSTLSSIIQNKEELSSWQIQVKTKSNNKNKYKRKTVIDINNLMNTVFLSTTSQNYINLFESEYFNLTYSNQIKLRNEIMEERLERAYVLLGYLRKNISKSVLNGEEVVKIMFEIQKQIREIVIGKQSIFKTIYKFKQNKNVKNKCNLHQYLSYDSESTIKFDQIQNWIDIKEKATDQVLHGQNIFGGSNNYNINFQNLIESFNRLKMSYSNTQSEQSESINQLTNRYSLFYLNIPTASQIIQEVSIIVLVPSKINQPLSLNLKSEQSVRRIFRQLRPLTQEQIVDKQNNRILDNNKIVEVMQYYRDVIEKSFKNIQRSLSDICV